MAFKPGQSGNPGGRPKAEREVIALARQAAPVAIARLVELVGHVDPRVAASAANSVLDRAFGRPTQPISGDEDRPPIGVAVTPSVEALALLSEDERAELLAFLGRIAGRSGGDGAPPAPRQRARKP